MIAPDRCTLLAVALRWPAVGLLALGLAAGCGNVRSTRGPAPSEVRQDLLRGTRAIQTTHDRRRLDAAVARAAARLRGAQAATARERRAKALALEGFALTRKGVRYLIRFDENDSGEVAAATRDAARANRFLRLAATRLRAAGLELGLRIGDLRGY
jgi:hypothetical protein